MSIETRLLTSDDHDAVMAMADPHYRINGIAPDHPSRVKFNSALPTFLDEYMTNGQGTVGAFADGTLISSVFVYLWALYPSASILNALVLPGAVHKFKLDSNGLKECVASSQDLCEVQGRFTQYTVHSAAAFRSAVGDWNRYQNTRGDRYYRWTDAIIPAGTRPKYDYQWALLKMMTWPLDVIIRAGTLKEEFRPGVAEYYRKNDIGVELEDVVASEKIDGLFL